MEYQIAFEKDAQRTINRHLGIEISQKELDEVNKKAYLEATYQFLKTAYAREHVRVFTEEGKLPKVNFSKDQLEMLHSQQDALVSKPPYIFLTINPRKDVSLTELQKAVSKLIKKKSLTHYAYVYEVRKANKGLHCHMLLKYDDKPYNFKRGVKNTLKGITDISNPEILNFKFVPHEVLQSKIDYMMGSKKDSKLDGVKATIDYRKQNKLEAIYHSAPPLDIENISLVGVRKSDSDLSDDETKDVD